jgi:hypothetical protein
MSITGHLTESACMITFAIYFASLFIMLKMKNGSAIKIVTGASNAYYPNLRRFIINARNVFPDSHLIVYDLGLNETSRKKVIIPSHVSLNVFWIFFFELFSVGHRYL